MFFFSFENPPTLKTVAMRYGQLRRQVLNVELPGFSTPEYSWTERLACEDAIEKSVTHQPAFLTYLGFKHQEGESS